MGNLNSMLSIAKSLREETIKMSGQACWNSTLNPHLVHCSWSSVCSIGIWELSQEVLSVALM